MVQNSSSAWLACCLLAEKSVYIRIFGKQQNVMLWSGGSCFVLFCFYRTWTLRYLCCLICDLLGKNSIIFSGLLFLFILLLYLRQCSNLSRMSYSVHTLGSDVWQTCQRVQYLWENSQIFPCSIFVSPLEFHAHLTVTCCCMQVLSDY